jgi:Holliday junction resolvase-like predicted endonuclease
MDWEALYITEERLFDLIKQATGLNRDRYDQLMQIFCIDPKAEKIAAGDGFYPPLLRLGDSLLFQPDILQLMFSSRNIPYAVNKIDRERFDTKLSPHLEPRLLQVAHEILQKVPNIRIGTNLKWEGGEIDMLVFHPEENVGLHIQAKAAMPPQGSRMVYAIETRVQEGIRQLTAFRLLPQNQKDSIISRVFNVQAVDVRIVDALLVWSSFGTKNIWDQLDHIATLNIPLLFMLVKKNRFLPVDQIVIQTIATIDEIVKKALPHWGFDRITLGEYEIEVPRFDYDPSSLFQYKEYLKEIK